MDPPPLLGIFPDGRLHDFGEASNVQCDILLCIPGDAQLKGGMNDDLMERIRIPDDEHGKDRGSGPKGEDDGSFEGGNEIAKEIYPAFGSGCVLIDLQ